MIRRRLRGVVGARVEFRVDLRFNPWVEWSGTVEQREPS
jgi:hypothetical protein